MVIKRNVKLDIDKTYTAVKAAFAQKGCKIISEKLPTQILAKQGSIWGTSPKTTKKIIDINLITFDSGTQVTCFSRLSSDWKNLALVGSTFAAVLVGLCLWIAIDLSAFMVTLKPSFWSWIMTVNCNIDFRVAQAFVSLAKGLAIFLSLTIVLEIAIIIYVHAKLDKFAEETLNSLSS